MAAARRFSATGAAPRESQYSLLLRLLAKARRSAASVRRPSRGSTFSSGRPSWSGRDRRTRVEEFSSRYSPWRVKTAFRFRWHSWGVRNREETEMLFCAAYLTSAVLTATSQGLGDESKVLRNPRFCPELAGMSSVAAAAWKVPAEAVTFQAEVPVPQQRTAD